VIGAAGTAYRQVLARWVAGVRRAALAVVAAAVVASAAGLSYSASHLGVFTDTADLLSKELPFRQRYEDYKKAFPQFVDNIAIVIEGTNPDVVQDAAATVAARLRQRPEVFGPVFDPASDPFFIRNGLLYLEVDELADLSERLADAEPLLATLAEDMTLRGLFEVLGLAIDDVVEGDTDPAALTDIFKGVADAVAALIAKRPFLLSWREMMMGDALDEDDYRRLVLVQPPLDYTTLRPARAAMDAIRELSGGLDHDAANGVRVRLTGGAALEEEELESVSEGAGVAGLLALILVGVLLVVGLGSWRLVVATLATLVMGLIWTAAFAALAIGHLNLISVTFVVLFIGLGVDFGIQYALRYREEVAQGSDSARALEKAAFGVGGALTLAAAAAAIGFFSFVPTAYVGLSELGVIAGASMFIALFANLTVLPALLALMPLPSAAAAGGADGSGRAGPARPTGVVLARLLGRPGAVTAGALVLGLAAVGFAREVRFDFNPLNLTDQTTESVQTFRDLMSRNSRAAYTVGVLAGDREEAVALAGRLEALEEVEEAVTLADFVPEDQDEKLLVIDEMNLFLFPVFEEGAAKAPPDEAERREALGAFRGKLDALLASPEAGVLAPLARRLAQGLDRFQADFEGARVIDRDRAIEELEASLLATLPARLAMLRRSLDAEEVTLDDLPADLRARLIAADGRALVQAVPAEDLGDNEALRRFVTSVRSIAPEATDRPVLMVEAGTAVITAFAQAGVIAFVAITLLLILLLRSAADTALVLLPLALAAALTMAAAVLLDISFNFANVITLPLLVSLGAAFGIHLVLRQRSEASVTAMLATSTPRAILFSALTTMCSFGTLAISSHRGTASMGQLLAISLTLALVCTLVVLPAMLELRARSAKPGSAPADRGEGR
jgi:hopanoid biosynthesis associated RND transporter like protein HpnN